MKALLFFPALACLVACHNDPPKISRDAGLVESLFQPAAVIVPVVASTKASESIVVFDLINPASNYTMRFQTFSSDTTYTMRVVEVNPGTNYTMGR